MRNNKHMKTILVDAFNTFVIKDLGIFQEMYNLLEKYPTKKIIVTNASDEQVVALGLVNLPYELYSLKHNPEKTDPEYFRILLKEYNLDVKDVIYFEHNPEAVDSAKSIGINSYLYDSESKNLVDLEKFLDANVV